METLVNTFASPDSKEMLENSLAFMNSPSDNSEITPFTQTVFREESPLKEGFQLEIRIEADEYPQSFDMSCDDIKKTLGSVVNVTQVKQLDDRALVILETFEDAQTIMNTFDGRRLKSVRAKIVLTPVNFTFPQQFFTESHCQSLNKFTCRYEVQIPATDDFKVARRIIGM